ncbi:MAG: HupE/UreJ family protein [Pikeienuella sp.]
MRRLLLTLLLALTASAATGHTALLAVMSLTEIQPGRYAMRWDNRPTDAEGVDTVEVAPIWPEGCAAEGMMLDCGPNGVSGSVGFEGLGVSQSGALLKITDLTGATQVVTLTPSSPTARVMPRFDPDDWRSWAAIFNSYVALGVEHILIGVDHLLFVLGLMWIAGRGWPLFKTVTAFTLAHSVTLGAVTFNWVGVPEAFVNSMIALSIVYAGVEIMRREQGRDSLTLRKPWLAAFGFGLLHGFGFAGALMQLGLPSGARLVALGAFNIGVEIGQLAFVLLVLALGWGWRRMSAPAPARPAPAAAYLIGGVASLWFIDRVVILLGA